MVLFKKRNLIKKIEAGGDQTVYITARDTVSS